MVDFNKGREERTQAILRTGGNASDGITVRDYFAGKAMIGMMDLWNVDNVTGETVAVTIARLSYKVADAMMAEREKAYEAIRQKHMSAEEAFGLEK